MENDRNSDVWRTSTKEVETQVSTFLQNGLVQRFEQFDQLLKSPDFDIEKQIALIRLQVGNYRPLSDGTMNYITDQPKNKATPAIDTKNEVMSEKNAIQGDKDSEAVATVTKANSVGVLNLSSFGTGNGVTGEKSMKRKLVDGKNGNTVGEMDASATPPKKQMQGQGGSCIILKPAGFALNNGPKGSTDTSTLGSQSNIQMQGNNIISNQTEATSMAELKGNLMIVARNPGSQQTDKQTQSNSIIAKQAGVAIPLIRSVLADLNLLEKQLNLLLMGPTDIIDSMDRTYFKGRLSASLESLNETKDIVANIDLEMYNYHVKRAKLISELGRNPSATPDILLSITYLDTFIFRRIHQILAELKNSYYLALTMDHILTDNRDKTKNNNNARNLSGDR